jgi:hypothetical protein
MFLAFLLVTVFCMSRKWCRVKGYALLSIRYVKLWLKWWDIVSVVVIQCIIFVEIRQKVFEGVGKDRSFTEVIYYCEYWSTWKDKSPVLLFICHGVCCFSSYVSRSKKVYGCLWETGIDVTYISSRVRLLYLYNLIYFTVNLYVIIVECIGV